MRAFALIAAAVVLTVFAARGTAAGTVDVTVGHSNLSIPCGWGVQAPADWYMPAGTPTGLVWLLHGWLGSKSDLAPLAQAIAARTGALVVAPSVSSWPWEQGACWILGEPLERAVASMFTDRTALTASAHAAGWAGRLPTPFVLAGHSSGGHLALEAAGDMVGSAGFANLRSVVLLDGGSGYYPPTPQELAALAALSGSNWRPVLQIASPAGIRPTDVTDALIASRPGQFVGVELKNGNHLDAAGYSNLLANLLVGWPRPENVQAVQTLASDWIGDALYGASNGILGGQPGQQFAVGAATVTVLG